MSSPTSRGKPRPATWWTLAILCAAALGVRSWGIGFQLPHRVEVDAHMVYQARMLAGSTTEVESYRGTYPLLLPRLFNLLPGGGAAPAPAEASLEEHRQRASADILRMRRLIALLSVLMVPATFLLARRLVSDGGALLAAGLVAFDLLHHSLSQQARPHAATAAFAAWAMLACLRMRRELTWRSCLLAGTAVGLTLGSLHNGLAMLLPLGAACLWRSRGSRWLGAVALAAVVALALWSYGTTWIAVDPDSGMLKQGSHHLEGREFNGAGFARIAAALWSYQPIPFVLALVGLAWLLVRRRIEDTGGEPYEGRDLLVIGAFVLPFLLANGIFARFDQRFAMPLIPYLSILAALAAERGLRLLAPRLGSPLLRRAAALAGASALLALPVALSLRLSWLRSRPDTLARAAEWIEAHLQPEAGPILVMMALDPPLFHDDESLELNGAKATEVNIFPRFTNWFRYQRDVQRRSRGGPFPHPRWSLAWVDPYSARFGSERVLRLDDRRPAAYALVERYPAVRLNPGSLELEQELRARGELLASFSCYTDGRTDAMHLEYEGPWPHSTLNLTRTLWACSSFGPSVEIYRLPAPQPPGGG